jgi:hypothetical protein
VWGLMKSHRGSQLWDASAIMVGDQAYLSRDASKAIEMVAEQSGRDQGWFRSCLDVVDDIEKLTLPSILSLLKR